MNHDLVQSALRQSSPYWQDGKNHLLFSVFPSTDKMPSFDKSMMAAAGLSNLVYRPGFDISIPAYSMHQETQPPIKQTRQWLAVMPQLMVKPNLKNKVHELARTTANGEFLILETCRNNQKKHCDVETGNIHNYPDVLSHATFCIILDTQYDAGQSIVEVLHHGCIPVIVSGSIILPFSEVLDWKRFSIQMYENDLNDIYKTLANISGKRIDEMQHQLSFIYNKYMSSWKAIVGTTLAILNDRIVPHHARNYKHWNLPPYVHGSNPLFLR